MDKTVECASNGNHGDINTFLQTTGACSAAGNSFPSLSIASTGWTITGVGGCADKQYNAAFTCTDDCGLAATASASLFVTDTQPPQLSAKTATDLVYFCDGRCASSFWYEKANARYLFEKWLNDAHGCLGGIDQCNAVDWEYTVTHDDGGMVDMNELCGTSGTVAFTGTDACGNAKTATVKYDFPIFGVPKHAELTPSVAEPTSCKRNVRHLNVCIPGTKPYDAAIHSSIRDSGLILFSSDTAAGCCFDQRISLVNGVVISEGHADTTRGECDTTRTRRHFVPTQSCDAVQLRQKVTADTGGCCFVRDRIVQSGKYEHKGHVESFAKDCNVSTSEMPTMVGFRPLACVDTAAVHALVADCNGADVCQALEASNDGIAVLRLQYVRNNPAVFAHSQTWDKRVEGIYSAAAYTAYIKIAGPRRTVLYSGTVADSEIFEVNSEATDAEIIGGQAIHVQLGVGKDNVPMTIGIDCTNGRTLNVGDVWGVLRIVGYTTKSGATCTARTMHGFRAPIAPILVVSEEAAIAAAGATAKVDAAETSWPILGGVVGTCIALALAIMGVVVANNKGSLDDDFTVESFNIDPDEQKILAHDAGLGNVEIFPASESAYEGSYAASYSVAGHVEQMNVIGAERTRWMQSLPADYITVEEKNVIDAARTKLLQSLPIDYITVEEEQEANMLGVDQRGGVSKLVHYSTAAPAISLDAAVAMAKSKLTMRALSAPSRMESEFI